MQIVSYISLIVYVSLGVVHNHSPTSPHEVPGSLFIELACKSKASQSLSRSYFCAFFSLLSLAHISWLSCLHQFLMSLCKGLMYFSTELTRRICYSCSCLSSCIAHSWYLNTCWFYYALLVQLVLVLSLCSLLSLLKNPFSFSNWPSKG